MAKTRRLIAAAVMWDACGEVSRFFRRGLRQFGRSSHRRASRRWCQAEALEPRELLTHISPIDPASLVFLPGGKGVFTDQDGDGISVKLTGPGQVAVVLNDPDGDGRGSIAQIVVQNTTSAGSVLSVTVKKVTGGNGVSDIGSVVGSGLKSFTASSSDLVDEGLQLDGFLGSLTIRDILNGARVEAGGTTSQLSKLTARIIADGAIISLQSAISSLVAVQFGTGQLTAPSLGTLTIKGDTKLQAAADFNADLELSGQDVPANKLTLTTVNISGTLRGTINVHGNAGTLNIAAIRGELNIDGNAKSIVVKEALQLIQGAADETGLVHVQGTAKIKGSSGSLSFSTATLFTGQSAAYRVEDLRRYDRIGSQWNYDASLDATARISGLDPIRNRGTGTATITSVNDPVIDGGFCAEVTGSVNDGEAVPTLTYCYSSDENGTHYNGLSFGDGIFGAQFTFTTSPIIAPALLESGRLSKATSPFEGTVTSGEAVGTLTGTAAVSLKSVGLEQISVPAGQFLAVKLEFTTTITGRAEITHDEVGTLRGSVTATIKQTVWAVPNVGIVMAVTNASLSVSAGRFGSASVSLKSTQTLTSFST